MKALADIAGAALLIAIVLIAILAATWPLWASLAALKWLFT